MSRKTHKRVSMCDPGELCRYFFKDAPDGFALYDADLRLVAMNNACISWFPPRLRKNILVGKHILEIAPHLKKSRRYGQYLRVLETGKPYCWRSEASRALFGVRNLLVRVFKVGSGLGFIISDFDMQRQLLDGLAKKSKKHISLSGREYDVFLRLGLGQRQKEVARALSLSFKTIHTYKQRLMKKMGMKSNAEITRYVIDHNLTV